MTTIARLVSFIYVSDFIQREFFIYLQAYLKWKDLKRLGLKLGVKINLKPLLKIIQTFLTFVWKININQFDKVFFFKDFFFSVKLLATQKL